MDLYGDRRGYIYISSSTKATFYLQLLLINISERLT